MFIKNALIQDIKPECRKEVFEYLASELYSNVSFTIAVAPMLTVSAEISALLTCPFNVKV